MSIDTLKCSFQFYAKYSNRVSLTVTQNPCAYHARALFRDCHWNWNSFFIVGTNTQKRYDIHIKHSFIATSTLQPIIWHTCDVKDKNRKKPIQQSCWSLHILVDLFSMRSLFSTSFDVIICTYDNSNHFLCDSLSSSDSISCFW